MSKRRAIILIAGLIILTGIGCLVYLKFATPPASEVDNAATAKADKAYKDPDSSLTFTYPYNWTVAPDADDTKSKDIFVADAEGEPLAQLQLSTGERGDFAADRKVNLHVYSSQPAQFGDATYAICASYADEGAAIPVVGLSRYAASTDGVLISTLTSMSPSANSPYKWVMFEMSYEEPPETEAEIQSYCDSDQAKQLTKLFASLTP